MNSTQTKMMAGLQDGSLEVDLDTLKPADRSATEHIARVNADRLARETQQGVRVARAFPVTNGTRSAGPGWAFGSTIDRDEARELMKAGAKWKGFWLHSP